MSDSQLVAPYDKLAGIYDHVMRHVDYEEWAFYIQQLIDAYQPNAESVLELGCGTGSLALFLQPQGPYDYIATDASEAMVRAARRKAQDSPAEITFAVADFTDMQLEPLADVVLLVYDGLNYITRREELQDLFQQMYEHVRPGGIAIFDQSTPANSQDNAARFTDKGHIPSGYYQRYSHYDSDTRLHTTTFDIVVDGERFRERHVQRAYSLQEIEGALQHSRLQPLAMLHNRTRQPASDASHRIHWVVKRPDSTK